MKMTNNSRLTLFTILAMAAILLIPAGMASAIKFTGNGDLCFELFTGSGFGSTPNLTGKDNIRGGHGNDLICGEGGNDKLNGSRGDDL